MAVLHHSKIEFNIITSLCRRIKLKSPIFYKYELKILVFDFCTDLYLNISENANPKKSKVLCFFLPAQLPAFSQYSDDHRKQLK